MTALKQMGRGISPRETKFEDRFLEVDGLQRVIDLIERLLWARTWVRQELILARQALLHCGFGSLEWIELPAVDQL